MANKVRLNIEVSEELARLLDNLADEEVVSKTEIIRRALAVMKSYREQIKVGRTHIGFTRDSDKLDMELIGVLTVPEEKTEAKASQLSAA